jgi:GxxExxY protein
MAELIFKSEAYKIIGACFEVFNDLGCGFLESVYQEALAREFLSQGIPFASQQKIEVYYKDEPLDKFFVADFICYKEIVIEIKAEESLMPKHEAQLLNYLKATKKPLGLLVNFGETSLKYKRFANTRKAYR